MAKLCVIVFGSLGYFIGWLVPHLDTVHGAIYGGLLGAAFFLLGAIGTEAVGLGIGLVIVAGLVALIVWAPGSLILGAIAVGLVLGVVILGVTVWRDDPTLA